MLKPMLHRRQRAKGQNRGQVAAEIAQEKIDPGKAGRQKHLAQLVGRILLEMKTGWYAIELPRDIPRPRQAVGGGANIVPAGPQHLAGAVHLVQEIVGMEMLDDITAV